MHTTSKNQNGEYSTDDDLSTRNSKPVNSSTTINHHLLREDHLKQQADSGIELDQTSSSSTIYNQKPSKDRFLFPQTNRTYDKTSPSTLVCRLQKQTAIKSDPIRSVKPLLSTPVIHQTRKDTYWNRFKQTWFRSLLLGLLILAILFGFYLYGLDKCSRSSLIQKICDTIICIENEGLPTI